MLHNNKNLKQDSFGANFKFKLLSVLQNGSQKGSILAVGVGLGALMIAGTTLAIATSSQNKTNVTSDEQTAQAVAAAEAGVARIQNLFIQEPRLAMAPNSKWVALLDVSNENELEEELNNFLGDSEKESSDQNSNSCVASGSQGSESSFTPETIKSKLQGTKGVVNLSSDGTSGWVDMENGADYRLVEYGNNSDTGTLVIQGRVNGSSVSEIAVDFPVELDKDDETLSGVNENVPALWIMDNSDNDFGNNNINGAIKISALNCDFTGKLPTAEKNSKNSPLFAVEKSSELMPPTPELPESGNYTDLSSSENSSNKKNGNNKKEALPKSLDSGNYLVSSISLGGSDTLEIKENSDVVIYLQGDFSMGGNSSINVPESSSLQIYGNVEGKYGCASGQTSPCNTESVKINGGGTTAKLFIHAPEATGGVNGGGNSYPNFSGSLWLKSWNGSSSNSGVLLGASGTYGDYISGQDRKVPTPPVITLRNINNWTRQTLTEN